MGRGRAWARGREIPLTACEAQAIQFPLLPDFGRSMTGDGEGPGG
jgi:hypothetical protein